jgi:hypothetical protein
MLGITTRRGLMAGLAMATLLGGWSGVGAAMADDQSAYYAACVKVSPGLKSACACRAKASMKASPELRQDIILSMSNPNAYTAKARAGKVSNDIIHQWEIFSADSAKQCGVDN